MTAVSPAYVPSTILADFEFPLLGRLMISGSMAGAAWHLFRGIMVRRQMRGPLARVRTGWGAGLKKV